MNESNFSESRDRSRGAQPALSAENAHEPNRFMSTLRETLEHIEDPEWLERNSPLASVFFAGVAVEPARRRQVTLTGRPDVDLRLRTTWHRWEAERGTPLQRLIWEALCRLPADPEAGVQAVLLLTYFEEPRPKQSEVVKLLALGRSTYYRHLDRAVTELSRVLVELVRPALRLELPPVRPLVGRAVLLATAADQLEHGAVVHLIGGSGLGKSSAGAHLAHGWAGPAFWYTIRRGLTDRLDALLFALAWFLHHHGESALWLYLNSSPQEVSATKALSSIRHALAAMNPTPLICIDEANLLLDGDDESDRLRSLLEDLAHLARSGAPLLLIGQKLLLPPEPGALFVLEGLQAGELVELLAQERVTLGDGELRRLLAFTRGNPLLLRLWLALARSGASPANLPAQLSEAATFDWFLARLERHLQPAELLVLEELAVFDDGAPASVWRRSRVALRTLLELDLVEALPGDRVILHPALQTSLTTRLDGERRQALHLAAAAIYAERGMATQAARHYVLGGAAEMAVWHWYHARRAERLQGQTGAALALFRPLPGTLATANDERVLALLLAELTSFTGESAGGLAVLEQITWPADSSLSVRAHELRGELLADVGEIERSLAEYRRSLEGYQTLEAAHGVHLRTALGRRALVYQRDLATARRESRQAEFDLLVLKGEIEEQAGHYAAAHRHYSAALELADDMPDDFARAKLHEVFGIMEAHHEHLDEAVSHLTAAGRYYRAVGNEICAVGVTNTNLAYAYLLTRRHAEAVAPAQRALEFFAEVNHPYWLALNETNLAEAFCYLGRLREAEAFARQALDREEAVVRPYCSYILGLIRNAQGRWAEAEQHCRDAIAGGEELGDPWATGPAWRVLGEVFFGAERFAEAGAAWEEALAIYITLGVEFEQQALRSQLGRLPA